MDIRDIFPDLNPPATKPGADRTWQDDTATRMARRAAASLVANPTFPQEEHLRPTLRPFGTFGHQPLFDYCAYTTWIWNAALELRSIVARNQQQDSQAGLLWTIALTLGAGLFGSMIHVLVGVACAALAFWIVRAILAPTISEELKKKVLEARLEYAEALLNGTPKTQGSATTMIEQASQLSSYRLPGPAHDLILVATEGNELFPGFGIHISNENIVARSSEDRPNESAGVATLNASLLQRLRSRLSGDNVEIGDVVRVAAATLDKSSPLLNVGSTGDKHLPLRLKPGEAELRWGRHGGLQRLLCVCVYDPASGFLVSGFVTFDHGCGYVSASYDLCLLAPAAGTGDALERRLAVLRYALKNAPTNNATTYTYFSASTEHTGVSRRILTELRGAVEAETRYSRELPQLLRDGDIETLLGNSTGLAAFCGEINDKAIIWPGSYYRSKTFLEARAVDLPRDPFVKRRLLTLTHQVANALGTSALETLEAAGYDVSEYKKEGRFVVKAEKIDQIFVGDQLIVQQNTVEKAPAPSVPSPKDTTEAIKAAEPEKKTS